MRKIINFFRESLEELKKVTWLTKDEAINSSIIVIGFIILFALFLSLIDIVVNNLILLLVK